MEHLSKLAKEKLKADGHAELSSTQYLFKNINIKYNI